RLVGMMGGSIGVASVPGEGSSFHFTARFGLGRPAAVAALPERTDPLRGLRALIADDNDIARELLVRIIASLGMHPVAVPHGAEALRAIAQSDAEDRPFDLLLLDWKMPVLDGIDCM